MTPRRALLITILPLLSGCGGAPASGSPVRLQATGGAVQLVDTLAAAAAARDPIAIDSARSAGATLRVSVSHAGGCAEHAYALVGERPRSGTAPARVLLAHDDGGDRCEAVLRRHLQYDLTPLIQAYRRSGWRGDTVTVHFEGSAWQVRVAP